MRGSVRISVVCQPAFDYGRKPHETRLDAQGASFHSDNGSFSLWSTELLKRDTNGGVAAEFALDEGKSAIFVFRNESVEEHPPNLPSANKAEELFHRTVKFWQSWLSACTYRGRWRERVERSALVLKLLTFEPTGAIVAAPTTSLPEVIGGTRNWDYRYTWLRDAAFTVYAFVRIGFTKEAAGFVSWMQNYVSKHVDEREKLSTVFNIHGDTRLPEGTLDQWEGYRQSAPVRIGNEAIEQYQNDIYGELMDSLYLHNKHVGPISYDFWVSIRRRLDWLCDNWQKPDEGIWEMRNRQEHFVYSKLMNWVALDRGIRLADKRSFPGNKERWLHERDRIYEEVMERGWNEKCHAFTQYYGSDDLDASLLIMPLVFFMSPIDPRMISTIKAILQDPRQGGLACDGLVYRYPHEPRIDGLPS